MINENTSDKDQAKALNKTDVSNCFYYRFIYKDEKGDLGYTVVKVNEKDSELAIATFESKFPHLVWRNFQQVFEK